MMDQRFERCAPDSVHLEPLIDAHPGALQTLRQIGRKNSYGLEGSEARSTLQVYAAMDCGVHLSPGTDGLRVRLRGVGVKRVGGVAGSGCG